MITILRHTAVLKAFNRLSINSSLCGPRSLGKSLWAQVKNKIFCFDPQIKKTKQKYLHSSVITVRQSLILCWKQWCWLSLPDPVLLVSGCLAHGRRGARDGGRRRTAEHPHCQRVVRKLCGTWMREYLQVKHVLFWGVIRAQFTDSMALVATTIRKTSVSDNACNLLMNTQQSSVSASDCSTIAYLAHQADRKAACLTCWWRPIFPGPHRSLSVVVPFRMHRWDRRRSFGSQISLSRNRRLGLPTVWFPN